MKILALGQSPTALLILNRGEFEQKVTVWRFLSVHVACSLAKFGFQDLTVRTKTTTTNWNHLE